jgi:hypothetical protein
MRVLVWFTLVATIDLVAQIPSSRPAFNDYPVKEIYRGTPVLPKLSNEQRIFRTVIRTGAKSPVEFAGHYTLPRFGCGTSCNGFYIVDSITGKVYDGFGVVELPGRWQEKQSGDPPERMEFRPNSRLLRINGCPNETNCGFYDYVLVDGEGLKLIKKQLLPKEFQY